MPTEDLVAGLREQRERLAAELAALDGAIAALGGGGEVPTPAEHMLASAGKRIAVGEDKIEDVFKYIKDHGPVRQADITHALQINSGTTSQAARALVQAGAVERGPKKDRSYTYRAVK